MALASTDFRGIVALDSGMVAQLSLELRQRESRLAKAVVQAFDPIFAEPHRPEEPGSLSEALQLINSRIVRLPKESEISDGTQIVGELIGALNEGLWDYLEMLEGVVADFFQELEQANIGHWDEALSDVVESVYFHLKSHSDELLLGINLLEDMVWKCRAFLDARASPSRWVECIQRFTRSLLDRQIVTNLREMLGFMEAHHHAWRGRFDEYRAFEERAHEYLSQADSYRFLRTLPQAMQATYRFIQRMVKVWELDDNARRLLSEGLVRQISDREHPKDVYEMYRAYFASFKGYLFATSRDIKDPQEDIDSMEMAQGLSSAQSELKGLHTAVARYREFLLRTDPNPYVRTRWGFSEWVVGPEPEACRQLLQVEYRLEDLDKLYEHLIQALTRTHAGEKLQTEEAVERELREVLRVMSQPLCSRRVAQTEINRLMHMLERLDELSSHSVRAVDILTEALSKVLRYDLRYSLLFGNADFHRLYTIHHELVAPLLAEPAHVAQREQLKQFSNRFLKWIGKGHLEKHATEVEQFFQSFQTYLQTLSGDANTIRQQILDFRYLLGSLYHKLMSLSGPGKAVRSRFVVLDHALEKF